MDQLHQQMLQIAATPFVGRVGELATLDHLIASPGVRLITLVGPGGIGKTRLALAWAEHQRGRFADGVVFIALAALTSGDHLVPVLAEALGLRLNAGESEARTPRQQLLDFMRHKRLLLILDNFEQVLDAAELVGAIVAAAPEVVVLVTSRERLQLRYEYVFTLQGLEVERAPHGSASSPALELFVQAARRVRPDFAITPGNYPHLVEICRMAGGMPLAIELAAAWADLLPPAAIASEIRHNLDLLATHLRDVAERQRSIRAVYDASWQRLAASERSAFARLSIFRGGFTRADALAVAEVPLHTLAGLAHKALLAYDRERDHYVLHELLRQYAAEQLASQVGSQEVADRHAAHYCRLLAGYTPDLRGERQQAALDAIEHSFENVWAAWHQATSAGLWESIEQAADCLGAFCTWRGRFADGLHAYRAAAEQLATIPEQPPARQLLLVRLLVWQSRFCRLSNQHDTAERLIDRCLQLLETIEAAGVDPREARAFVYLEQGRLAHDAGHPEAGELYERSLATYEALGLQWHAAEVLIELSRLANNRSDFAAAQRFAEASLAIHQAWGDQRGAAHALEILSQTAAESGRLSEAEQLVRRSNRLYQAIGDRAASAAGLTQLGVILMWLGNFTEARATLEQSCALYQHLGNQAMIERTSGFLGLALTGCGRFDQALPLLQEGIAHQREFGTPRQRAWSLWALGFLLLGLDRRAEAEQALRESIALHQVPGNEGQLGWSLALLAYLAWRRNDLAETHAVLQETLRTVIERRDFLGLVEVLPTIALMVAERGQTERAIELYGLAWHYPVISNSAVFKLIAGDQLTTLAASLPPPVAAAARERGRTLDLWRTAALLLEDLPDLIALPVAAPSRPIVQLDHDARELLVDGQRTRLAPLEFAVLRYLVEHEGKAVSRVTLLNDVWGYSYEGGSNVVDAVVRALRKKLGAHASAIETVTKVGYRYRSRMHQ